MKFINLTKHSLTEEQIKDVISTGFDKDSIQVYPNPYTKQTAAFYKAPPLAEVRKAAVILLQYAEAHATNQVAVVGAPYSIGLEEELDRVCVIQFHYELQAKQVKR